MAADGSFDDTIETVTGVIDTDALAPGRHLVYVSGTDASGREGGGPPTQPPFRPTMSKPQEYHCYKQLHQTGSNREAF